MYQIVEIRPTHCQITDGIIGSSAHPLPMTYRSEALAHKLAGRIAEAHYENCGDNSYVVVEAGKSPYQPRVDFSQWRSWPIDADTDFPF